MNAIPPSFTRSDAARPEALLPGSGRAAFGQGAANAMSMKWAALQDAAGAVAALAGCALDRPGPEVRNFPAQLRNASGWRRQQAENGVADLAAIMESGLAALLSVNARGADAAPAASALLREFIAARDALLAMAPPSGALGPHRSA
ncbi:MAG: hypothetical protein AB7G24_03400 [Novosphingobium sp.]